MNPKLTPEMQQALQQHPTGPIQLDTDANVGGPVFLVRLDDIANLQQLVDERIREKLADADADIAGERVEEWNPAVIKQRGRERVSDSEQS